MAYKKKAKKQKLFVEDALIHIKATFNNTLVVATTTSGDVIARCSAGRLGFKGARKGTPFAAAQIASTVAAEIQKEYKVKNVSIQLNGPGNGREAAARAIQSAGLNVDMVADVTPVPHNGCRAPKRRRV